MARHRVSPDRKGKRIETGGRVERKCLSIVEKSVVRV